jgi:uncharacterized membrane protein (DUF2068 family)
MKAVSVLYWIVAFKAFKTTVLFALGVTLLVTRHAEPVDLLTRLALAIHLPLSSALFQKMASLVLDLSVGRQTALAVAAFAYAALMAAEGSALYLRKRWARWFTIVATGSLIPIEVYEIVREIHPVRVLVLAANLAIIVYLLNRKELFE